MAMATPSMAARPTNSSCGREGGETKERGGVMECAGRREKLSSTEARCAHVGEGVAGSWAVCLAISRGYTTHLLTLLLVKPRAMRFLVKPRSAVNWVACTNVGGWMAKHAGHSGRAAGCARGLQRAPGFGPTSHCHFCNARLDCSGSTASKPVNQAQPV